MVSITKLNSLLSRFWFLLRGLTWAVLHVWTQNNPQNVGTCPGLPLQLLARNPFFQIERPENFKLNGLQILCIGLSIIDWLLYGIIRTRGILSEVNKIRLMPG